MVVHRQATVVLGLPHVREGQPSGTRNGRRPPRVEQDRGPVALEYIAQRVQLDLLDIAEGAPDWHSQLVPPDIREPGLDQVLGQPHRSPAEWTVAVQD